MARSMACCSGVPPLWLLTLVALEQASPSASEPAPPDQVIHGFCCWRDHPTPFYHGHACSCPKEHRGYYECPPEGCTDNSGVTWLRGSTDCASNDEETCKSMPGIASWCPHAVHLPAPPAPPPPVTLQLQGFCCWRKFPKPSYDGDACACPEEHRGYFDCPPEGCMDAVGHTWKRGMHDENANDEGYCKSSPDMGAWCPETVEVTTPPAPPPKIVKLQGFTCWRDHPVPFYAGHACECPEEHRGHFECPPKGCTDSSGITWDRGIHNKAGMSYKVCGWSPAICDVCPRDVKVAVPAETSSCFQYFQKHGQMLPAFVPGSDGRSCWWNELMSVKKACQIDYDGSFYDHERVQWASTDYVQTQMHPFDRYFWDPETGTYTVDRFLEDLKTRYGGVDSLLLWPTYPNIGVDNRNQFDYFYDLPGGLPALALAIDEIQMRGVKVLLPYNPWDLATRRLGVTHAVEMAKLLRETHAQGINGDTMDFVNYSFVEAAGGALAIEPELYGNPMMRNWHNLAWGYWSKDLNENNFLPQVDFHKFAVDSRFMTHACERWSKNHSEFIQNAFFNGVGFVAWENVWGIWNGMTPRDSELLRRVSNIERFFGRHGFLTDPDWEPFSKDVTSLSSAVRVVGSGFQKGTAVLYLLVNRYGAEGTAAVKVPSSSALLIDCHSGTSLSADMDGGSRTVTVRLEPVSIGCVFFAHDAPELSRRLHVFMRSMKEMTARPLSSFSWTWTYLKQTMVPVGLGHHAAGMIKIPGGRWHFHCSSVQVEGFNWKKGVDVQFPWEDSPRRLHSHWMDLEDFYIDRYPVTVADYARYLDATNYRPTDNYNKNWLVTWDWSTGEPKPREGWEKKPVTHVGLSEARKYCKWRNARLPHSYEWQRAAQGHDKRPFPWGWHALGSRYPKPTGGPDNPIPADVDAHPSGKSPFGVMDLLGNVWQYTDEFQDEHTRAVILRGSSRFWPKKFGASAWYFPRAVNLKEHNKYFLMSDSYERAATIGFRCAADGEHAQYA